MRSTPVVADFNQDGTPDVATLAANGTILVRFGIPGTPGTFAPPVVLNADPSQAARDLTVVTVQGKSELAALNSRTHAITFSAWRPGSGFIASAGPAVPTGLPVRIISGDVNGDGRQDLIVGTAGYPGQVCVYLQQSSGAFGTPTWQVPAGLYPSDLALVDLDGTGRPDIVVTSVLSGGIRVLENGGSTPFSTQLRFRADSGLAALTSENGFPTIESDSESIALASGCFDGGPLPSLVVADAGSDHFSLLANDGLGGLFNPVSPPGFTTGSEPAAIVTGDFTGNGILDLAILNRDSGDISIFLGDGHGGFTKKILTGPDGEPISLSAGNAPTGLAVAEFNGKVDLLVGNQYGDVLILEGNGDGTFQPYQRLDQHVALAVGDVNGDGRQEFVLANAGQDQVRLLSDQPGQDFVEGRQDGVLKPNAVKLADLNGDGIPDLVVANGGGNDVLVYLGLGNGQFGAPQSFFTGTDPVAITIADLTGNGIPDLVVANYGSNDVSILYGQGRGSAWTLTEGPRLDAGLGPIATAVADVYGNGLPDILVSNSGSNNVYLLPGVGGGFFDDTRPILFQTGTDPEQVFVGRFSAGDRLDLVTVNAGSNDLTFFPDVGPGRSIAIGGSTPMAAVMGNFGRTGLNDLVVLNSGDNSVALLVGGPGGPQLQATQALTTTGQLSDLALGMAADNSVNVYVTLAGQDSVVPLTFFLDAGPILSSLGETGVDQGPGRPVTEFASVGNTPFETVPTLLLVPNAEGPAELEHGANESGSSAASARQSGGDALAVSLVVALMGSYDEVPAITEATEQGLSPDESPTGIPAPLGGFIQGLDSLPFESRLAEGDSAPAAKGQQLPAPLWELPGAPDQPAPGDTSRGFLDEVFRLLTEPTMSPPQSGQDSLPSDQTSERPSFSLDEPYALGDGDILTEAPAATAAGKGEMQAPGLLGQENDGMLVGEGEQGLLSAWVLVPALAYQGWSSRGAAQRRPGSERKCPNKRSER